jgi:hypothetical protein
MFLAVAGATRRRATTPLLRTGTTMTTIKSTGAEMIGIGTTEITTGTTNTGTGDTETGDTETRDTETEITETGITEPGITETGIIKTGTTVEGMIHDPRTVHEDRNSRPRCCTGQTVATLPRVGTNSNFHSE